MLFNDLCYEWLEWKKPFVKYGWTSIRLLFKLLHWTDLIVVRQKTWHPKLSRLSNRLFLKDRDTTNSDILNTSSSMSKISRIQWGKTCYAAASIHWWNILKLQASVSITLDRYVHPNKEEKRKCMNIYPALR